MTAFGRFLKSRTFEKLFTVLVLAAVSWGGVANVRALLELGVGAPAVVLGVLYAAGGVLMLFQKSLTCRWKQRWLEVVIGLASCVYIYNFMYLLLWKLCALVMSVSVRTDAYGTLCALALTLLTVAAGHLYALHVRLRRYSIDLGLGGGYRIALLSDIHLGAFVREGHVRRIVNRVNALDADLVVICGDIIDSSNNIMGDDSALERMSCEFRNIRAREGVFAVLGNHDPSVEDERFTDFLRDSGIQLLHNSAAELEELLLIGRTDSDGNYRAGAEELGGFIGEGKPVVVLDHNPHNIPEDAALGAALVLCGHTHKGQFFPVTIFTKMADGARFFYGHERFGATHAVITSGAGFFQLPVRLGTSSEVVEVRQQ